MERAVFERRHGKRDDMILRSFNRNLDERIRAARVNPNVTRRDKEAAELEFRSGEAALRAGDTRTALRHFKMSLAFLR